MTKKLVASRSKAIKQQKYACTPLVFSCPIWIINSATRHAITN